MTGSAAIALRVALAWVLTYVLASGLAELTPGSIAQRAARASGSLPAEDARDPGVRRAIVARTARDLDLDGGTGRRLGRAARRAVTLDLGEAWRDRRPVVDVVGPGLAATGLRALEALLLALLLGGAVGLGAAGRGGVGGALLGGGVALALTMPQVWWCQLVLATWTPAATGAGVLAVVALALVPAAVIAAHVRTQAEEVLASPLAAALTARGMSRTRLLAVHVARLTAPGLAPLAATAVGYVLGASAVVERALAVPGAGRTLADAAATGDVPVVAALAALAAAVVALVAGLASATARRLDPRLASSPEAA